MDAIAYLRQEHSKVRKLLDDIYNATKDSTKSSKFKTLCKDLMKHETTEEKIWYPILRKDPEMKDIIKHLVNEEKTAAKSLKIMVKQKVGLIWKLKFIKLRHDINHHAKDEEKELFPRARKYLTKTELNELGSKMKKFKNTLHPKI